MSVSVTSLDSVATGSAPAKTQGDDLGSRSPELRAGRSLVAGALDWRASYRRRVLGTDILAVVAAVLGAHIAWFGLTSATVAMSATEHVSVSYGLVSLLLAAAWVGMLGAAGSRDDRVVGAEFTEYRRLIAASVGLFGTVATVAYLAKTEIARGYLITALPVGLALLLGSRWAWRQWVRRQREKGRFSSKVLLVGARSHVAHLAAEFARNPASGFCVVGAVVPGDSSPLLVGGTIVPVTPDLDGVVHELDRLGADTVAVTGSDALPPDKLRELSWSLEPGRRHLVLAASLTDVAGPRLHSRPVAGLPLIHVETPQFEGARLRAKRAFDLIVTCALLLILAPVLLLVGVVVKTSDGGPVLFRQRRVGLNGREFEVLKFRSMVVDAEARLVELQRQQADGNGVLFKLRNDPRMTPIGAFLRRLSIDELPQLVNVLRGDMSLVGPRPSLPAEVDQYEQRVHRRFLVKPGITGLWQVSGRSNLSWEASVRLDLFYVENWSITADLVILWRTARAVLGSSGAY